MVLDRIIARDSNLLRLHLLGATGIASDSELGNAYRIALNLKHVSRRIILGILADAARISEAGSLIVVVVPWIRVRIVVDDAAASMRLICLGLDVLWCVRVGHPGPLRRRLVPCWRGALSRLVLSAGGIEAPAKSAQSQEKGQRGRHASATNSHELRVLKGRF
jgi:hypothetical protein